MPNYRPHQEAADNIGLQLATGQRKDPVVIAEVIPGGGKTALAIIMACRLFEAGLIDSVLWVVPRITLCDQVQEAWAKERWANRLGKVMVPSEGRTPLYPADADGAIVSYQAFERSPQVYFEHLKHKRCFLVLDELQLLCEKQDGELSSWASVMMEASKLATYTLGMGGYLARRKKHQLIPLVKYTEPDAGGVRFPKPDISYGLHQAIADSAIRPPEFELKNASVRFEEGSTKYEMLLAEAEPEKEWNALRTFIYRPETWQQLIDNAVSHWKLWCTQQAPHASRIVFVCADQEMAREVNVYVARKHKILAVLAISDEGEAANRDLRKFRLAGRPEAIVTVGKTAIGFDAPDCTHMVYLGMARSLPYVLQVLARVWRMQSDLPETVTQAAWFFVPNDPRMLRLIAWFMEQKRQGIKALVERKNPPGTKPGDDTWTPIGSEPRESAFATHEMSVSGKEAGLLERWRNKSDVARTMTTSALLNLLKTVPAGDETFEKSNASSQPNETEQQFTHGELREKLSRQSRILDRLKQVKLSSAWRFGDTERQLPKGWVASATIADLKERNRIISTEAERLKRLPDLGADAAAS